jgi:hypothetical protein
MDERDVEAEWVRGVCAWAVDSWKEAEFSPFDVALAQGDGFTPATAAHDHRRLQKPMDSSHRAGIEPSPALQLHRSGLGAGKAAQQGPEPPGRDPSLDSSGSTALTEDTNK